MSQTIFTNLIKRYSKAYNISPCHCKCLQGGTLKSVTRSHTARGSETAITGTSGRSIVETTSSARTIERSLADVATVDTLTLTRGVMSIVSNQLSVKQKRSHYFVFSYFRNSPLSLIL